jgi:hypothetical protein
MRREEQQAGPNNFAPCARIRARRGEARESAGFFPVCGCVFQKLEKERSHAHHGHRLLDISLEKRKDKMAIFEISIYNPISKIKT